MTKYRVLEQTDNGSWDEIGEKEAGSGDMAIKALGGGDGVFVAVPDSSWKPAKLTVVDKPRLVLSRS